MNYCIMAWGSQCEIIYKVQKKAVRILTTSRYNSHTDPLFKRFNLLKITDLLRLQELMFYCKFMHNQLPSYLQNWQLTPNANIHTHNTRRQHELHTFRTQHEFAKRCLRHNLPNTLNNTPALVIEKIITHSLSGFANYTKHQYMQNYQTSCNIANCYTCRQNQ